MKKRFSRMLTVAIMILAMVPSMAFATEGMSSADFLALADSNNTITLTEDITLSEAVTITEETVIDLNGHKLTLADVPNYGLVVKNIVTIKGNGELHASGAYGIGVSTAKDSVLMIDGGKYTASAKNVYLIGNWGEVYISDGDFTGTYCVLNNFNYNNEVMGSASVDGGTFKVTDSDGYVFATGNGASLYIGGGNVSGALYKDEKAVVTIEGGVFDTDVSDSVGEGFAQNEDGEVTCAHNETMPESVDATCTEAGYKDAEICTVCGEIVKEGTPVPATGKHDFADGKCNHCGIAEEDVNKDPAGSDDNKDPDSGNKDQNAGKDDTNKDTSDKKDSAVQTGDETNLLIPFLLGAVSLVVAVITLATRKRRYNI